jgi:lipopolysaccharide/colanic/teichoic acid biosynthesis glycosyltransferase|nr:sugar transferase [Geothrix sp.]
MSNLVKRCLDLTVSSLLLLLIWPILVLLWVLIRWGMGTPTLYRQVRPGYRGRLFQVYKFRTMNESRDVDGLLLPDRDRLTCLGRWMRRLSLDELPQLFNVVLGDMSLVGPRPLLMQYLERYSPEQARRHEVRPGITGWAQVNGRNALSWEEKFRLDVWYVDHQTFWLDLRILFLTAWKVVRRDGISAADSATMPEFLGTNPPPKS